MNTALLEAKLAPATLETREKGKAVLVRTSMIDYINGICNDIDDALAQFPLMLEKHGLGEYDDERMQRLMLKGFGDVYVEIRDRTRARLDGAGLFPKLVEDLATKNADYIPKPFRDELEDTLSLIKGRIRELDCPLDLETLVFESGKLSIPQEYRAAIQPRYTLIVPGKDRKTVEMIREAARFMSELQARGVRIRDEMRIPPAGGQPMLCPGLISRMVAGEDYTDAELLGLLQGIDLSH